MAESVEKRLEQFTPAFEQLISIGAFTKKEVKAIIKKRRAFEYSLTSKMVTPENYLSYITYEAAVMQLTEERKNKSGIEASQRLIADLEWPKHIHSIYRRANSTFPDNIKLWYLYFDYCQSTSSMKSLSIAFDHCIKFHSNNPDLWIRAAQWEMKDNNNPELAREYMQQAVKLNPTEPKLYSVYAETLIFFAQLIEKRREVQGIEEASNITRAPLAIFEEALQKCHQRKAEVLNLFIELFSAYNVNDSEIIQKSIDDGDFGLLDIIARRSKDTLKQYQEFLKDKPSRGLSLRYLEYLGNQKMYSLMSKVLDQLSDLSVEESIRVAEMFIEGKMPDVAEEIISSHSNSPEILEEKLKIIDAQVSNLEDFVQKSTRFLQNHNTPNLNSLYLFFVAKKSPSAEKWIEIIKSRSYYLDSLTSSKLMKFTLAKYNQSVALTVLNMLYQIVIPTTDFLKAAIDVTKAQEIVDNEKIRSFHELATSKWGKDDMNVWIDYLQFEFDLKNYKKLETIRSRASQALNDSSEFMRVYLERFCKSQ